MTSPMHIDHAPSIRPPAKSPIAPRDNSRPKTWPPLDTGRSLSSDSRLHRPALSGILVSASPNEGARFW